jgi:hypothetical protein
MKYSKSNLINNSGLAINKLNSQYTTFYLLYFDSNECSYKSNSTVSFTDLDQGSETIICKSILTTFEASSIFKAAWVVAKVG